jgi:hypothetical protein
MTSPKRREDCLPHFKMPDPPKFPALREALYDHRFGERSWFPFAKVTSFRQDFGEQAFSWGFGPRHMRFTAGFGVGTGFVCSTRLSCCGEPIRVPDYPWDIIHGISDPIPFSDPHFLAMYSAEKVSVATPNLKK